MKSLKVYSCIGLLSVLMLITACVREGIDRSFKKPSKDDLNRATALYIQMTYKYLENKDYEKAMSSVKRALDIDKNAPAALNTLAIVYQSQGDIEKARETFKKTLKEDDKYSEAHLNYGQFLFQQKEYKAACKEFQSAANDDFYQRRSSAYFYLAICEKTLGNLDASEFALGRCLGLDPSNTQAMGMLSSIKFEKKQYPEAKALFDEHVKVVRSTKQNLSAEALWLGIQLERVFNNEDGEASWALNLKNNYPYSKEYLEYQNSLKK